MELATFAVVTVAAVAAFKLFGQTRVPPPPPNVPAQTQQYNQQGQGLGGDLGSFFSTFFNGGTQPQTSTGSNQLGQGIGAAVGGFVQQIFSGGGGVNSNYNQGATTPQTPSTDVNGWNSFPGSGGSSEGYKLSEADDYASYPDTYDV